MGAFFIRYKWLTGALAVVVAFAIAFDAWSTWIRVDPLDVPLTVSPPGRIEAEVDVRQSCPHRLILRLSSQTRPREEMKRLVGGFGTAEGIDIPLRWSFRDATGRVVASEERETAGSYAFDSESFYRAASEALPLQPGKYRLDAAPMDAVAGLEDVSIRMYLRCHAKSSAGWQTDLLVFGFLAWLLAWPLAVGLALALVVLAVRD